MNNSGSINVFKFGGASVKDAQGIINVGEILKNFKDEKIAVVVSATGKTTNHLERVVDAYVNKKDNLNQLLDEVKSNHLSIVKQSGIESQEVIDDLLDTFVEIEWLIEDEPHDSYDYIYDQIVSVGELISSKILCYYLNSIDIKSAWLDVRGVLFTDEIYREAKVDWAYSSPLIAKRYEELLQKNDFVVTQGFIGSTLDNNTTTLGREGSDYTAAILSYCLDAAGMHIWKDVPGVLTGDPRIFEHVTKLERLTYKEAIEMTYYGAKVIHPKTIKPLQNKSIPLFVRPFDDVTSLGTKVSDVGEDTYPPIIVIEPNQSLIHISVNDFSFVAEQHLSNIFKILAELRLKVNMMRNSAISFTICVPFIKDKIEILKEKLQDDFSIVVNDGLELVTIRHYNKESIAEMTQGKLLLFEERLNDNIQMVIKDIPIMKRK